MDVVYLAIGVGFLLLCVLLVQVAFGRSQS